MAWAGITLDGRTHRYVFARGTVTAASFGSGFCEKKDKKKRIIPLLRMYVNRALAQGLALGGGLVLFSTQSYKTVRTPSNDRDKSYFITRQQRASRSFACFQLVRQVEVKVLMREWFRAQGNWTAVEGNQADFSDESRFNLSSDDNRVHVWRPRGERLNPAFALQQHTAPTAGVILWGTVAYKKATPIMDPWHHDSPAVCP
ncbi:transposable element Tcb2 transposase [Trichonephila clavipes]|nr:transposable element Tcb2 transposase [Trichonephila clavipes]